MAINEDNSDYPDNLDSIPNTQPDEYSDEALLNSGHLKPKRLTFKEQWEQVDETCPSCGKVTVPATGITRQNIKKLFSFQTDIQSLTILFLFIMCAAFAFTTYTYMNSSYNCSNVTNIDPSNLNNPSNPLLLDPALNICALNSTDEGCSADNFTLEQIYQTNITE